MARNGKFVYKYFRYLNEFGRAVGGTYAFAMARDDLSVIRRQNVDAFWKDHLNWWSLKIFLIMV